MTACTGFSGYFFVFIIRNLFFAYEVPLLVKCLLYIAFASFSYLALWFIYYKIQDTSETSMRECAQIYKTTEASDRYQKQNQILSQILNQARENPEA
jgi:hypothetical protein